MVSDMAKNNEKIKVISQAIANVLGIIALVVVLTNCLYPSLGIPLWLVALSTVLLILVAVGWFIIIMTIVLIYVFIKRRK